MSAYQDIIVELTKQPRRWLVTGVAGFIGSNLLETLLSHNQVVVGLDNFATGHRHNLEQVKEIVGEQRYRNFQFIEGDICDLACCREAAEGVDCVLHQAALGSVPRSIDDPIRTNASNVTGFLNMLVACRDAGVKSFTYAASSSTYGDHPALPKIEENIGNPLSPYAVTKYVNELYADVFSRCYEFNCIGLRYFNVFGPRQDPNGAYAAVIPKWIAALLEGLPVHINGKGDTSRDFCFVHNAVQANLLAATSSADARNEVYNVAVGDRTSLTQLYYMIRNALMSLGAELQHVEPVYGEYRAGDVKHSQADISKIVDGLGYVPEYNVERGLELTTKWFRERSAVHVDHSNVSS